MSDKPIERSCDTCEHEYDSSNEYCGACDDVTSQWKEAGWHRYESSSKQIVELQAENKRLIEEYGEATDTIQDMIDVLKDTKKRLEKSRCPHAIAAGAWLEQALEGKTND